MILKQTDEYIIVESKYTSTGNVTLGNTLDGPQMSDGWILGVNTGDNRILNIVNDPVLAQEIEFSDYKRVISKILPDGTITYKELNSLGNIIGDWTP